MELSSFSENIITEQFERNGEIVNLKINIDAVVPEYYDVLSERLAPTMKRLDDALGRNLILQNEITAIQEQEKQDEAARKKGKKPKTRKPVDIQGMTERARVLQREIAEINREMHAERLTCPVKLPDGSYTCVLKAWDVTENGIEIAASKENLLRLPTKAVESLAEFIGSKLNTVKKREDEETEETSANTHSGSMALRAV